jgi:Uma2 family endonuclease
MSLTAQGKLARVTGEYRMLARSCQLRAPTGEQSRPFTAPVGTLTTGVRARRRTSEMAVERAARTPKSADPVEERAQPRLFTVVEYDKMAEAGILKPDERVELIEGVIIQMPPIGPEHADSVDIVAEVFGDRLRPRARIRVQNPIELADVARPQPDITILRRPDRRARPYRAAHPGREDILLVVEVADTSLAYDLGEKAIMYAQRGVSELWVVDIPHDRLVVHRDPTADGYASVDVVERGATVSPSAFPDIAFTADEILG